MNSVQCTPYSTLFSAYNRVYSVECTAFSLQCTVYSVQCTLYTMRKNVFDAIHKISHPGKRSSRRLVSRSFVWEFLSKDVNLWAQSCLDCQRSKIQSHVKSPVQHIPVPGRRFSHIHVDLVGPLPQSDGFSYLFTIIDR